MPPPRRPKRPAPPSKPSGYAARAAAVACLVSILERGRPLDDAFDAAIGKVGPLESRDRAFARLLVMTVLRRRGELESVVSSFLTKTPPDSGSLVPILLSASAQLLILETPPHAAISLAVDLSRADPKARRFDRLTNAVLRRVSTEGKELLTGLDPVACNVPDWLLARWREAYGDETAREIAAASLTEAPLDLSAKAEAGAWAERLGGHLLATGTIRLSRADAGRVEALPGYGDGAWWVQDAGAALPVRLLEPAAGQEIADLCAAPGGKTAELAAAGAIVTAVDQSPARLSRLKENLARLKLEADVVEADLRAWEPERLFDGVLLDAPCSATGTIRRHPDILHLRRKDDTSQRVALQEGLLDKAAQLVRPGGRLVYCVCSLEPEEGERQIAKFLSANPDFVRLPIAPGEAGIDAAWITPEGDLRTLPFHLPHAEPELSGMDGFYAARLARQGADYAHS
ncbi:transcription antitermination factor NusB [Hyphomicrobium sp. CS1GBMeth3]|uniref:RsmB/NOP family class I SAM-dependent RNA methyltransferase n=1 Tax=Hyphomicrobium sp. CS1GBMeth3 TaxID=1892845 RepID=UPI000930317A|nr:transcription antitermination factor NusB [Hyphomicrobium sp. CS1GBMeth3]